MVADAKQSLTGWDNGLNLDTEIIATVSRRLVQECNEWVVR